MELEISNKTIIRVLSLTAAFIGSIYLGVLVWRQIVWLLIAFFFALALEPWVAFLSKYMPKKSRILSLVIVFAIALGLISFVVAVLAPPITNQVGQIAQAFPSYLKDFLHSNNFISNFVRANFDVSKIIANQETLLSRATSASGWVLGSFFSLLSSLAALLTILVFTFFMVLEGPKLMQGFWEIQPKSKLEKRKKLLNDMHQTVIGFVNGSLIRGLVAGIGTTVLLFILQLPFAIALGVLAGLIDLIPLIGATLGAVIVTLVALAFGGLTKGIIVLIFFVIYQQIENYILQPLIFGKTLKISPLITAIAALFGVVLAGFVGALVAIPVAASLQILIKEYLVTHKEEN